MCFTKAQVKVFLETKVELNNCEDQYNVLAIEKDSLQQTYNDLDVTNVKNVKKLKRTRKIGGGLGILALLFGVLLFK